MRRLHLLALIFVMTSFAAAPTTAPDDDPPPGGIHLLEGYHHKREQGQDTSVGRIWKEGGLEIRYDIGRLAGNYAEKKKEADRVWTRRQAVQGRRVEIVKTRDDKVFVSFASDKDDTRLDYPANFFATIKNDEELADLLLTVLTYTVRSTAANPPMSSAN